MLKPKREKRQGVMPLKKEDFKLEELPEVYQELSELVGIENMLKIAEAFGGGESIYFPKLETLHRPKRNNKIIEDFNGYNYKFLAKKYKLSEAHIRLILRQAGAVGTFRPTEGQCSMFDD